MIMKVKLDGGAYLPRREHEKDAGYDLFTLKRFILAPREVKAIDTGVHIQLPDGKCGVVFSKSGLLKDYKVLSMGLIDEPYRGAIGAILVNLSGQSLTFERGEKISQFYIIPNTSQQNIAGFQIEVDHLMLMQIAHNIQKLSEKTIGILNRFEVIWIICYESP